MKKVPDVGLFESKTRLSELIQRVAEGERFYITKRGRRVAELRPVEEDRVALRRGCAKNDGYQMSPDFDAPLDELADYS